MREAEVVLMCSCLQFLDVAFYGFDITGLIEGRGVDGEHASAQNAHG